MEKYTKEFIAEKIKENLKLDENVHPGFSVDCVIITFYDNKLKILLNKLFLNSKWMLPGGYVYKDEDLEHAAYRILKNRTSLKDVYLEQFYTFGAVNRTSPEENEKLYASYGVEDTDVREKHVRFISTAYFALVEYNKVVIRQKKEDECKWFDIEDIPSLYADHNQIIEKALKHIRAQLEYLPIGFEMLPEKFTITELRKIHEGILGKELDRRNFQKKMLSSELIIKLDERRDTTSYPPPILFSFNKEKIKALREGL